MKDFDQDIEARATRQDGFCRVLYTAKNCQLVLMALNPQEEIGAEVDQLDQFFWVDEGSGEAVLDGVSTSIDAGFAVLVPAGVKHRIVNTGSQPLTLYTLYAPPNHRDVIVHHPRADAAAAAAAAADSEDCDSNTSKPSAGPSPAPSLTC